MTTGMSHRVLVCGSRDFYNAKMIREVLKTLPRDTVIIEGEARGADTHARIEGECLGFQIEKYPAQWDKYGKRAGYLRNQQMLDEGKPDEVIAFCSKATLEESRGTAMMVRIARDAGIPTRVFFDRGNA